MKLLGLVFDRNIRSDSYPRRYFELLEVSRSVLGAS